MVDIYMPVVECGYVPFFADVLSVYFCILLLAVKSHISRSEKRFLNDIWAK
jgi:hypothetical protein